MRITLTIPDEVADGYKLYAATVPRAMVIAEKDRLAATIQYALRDWTDRVGEGHIEDALGIEDPVMRAMMAEYDRAVAALPPGER